MSVPRVHLDFETRSFAPFGSKDPRNVGLYKYARHPTTSVWCFAYRLPGEHVQSWWRDQPFPVPLIEHVAKGGTVVAHNAAFEFQVWNETLNRQLGGWLPPLQLEQMDCTMARCRALSLPADLERAARVVNAPYQKDMSGSDNMIKMAKPRKVTWDHAADAEAYERGDLTLHVIEDGLAHSIYGSDGRPVLRVDWWYDDTLRNKQNSYCMTDVLAEEGVDAVVSPLSPSERKLWLWNERVNQRGIPFDVPMLHKIEKAAEHSKALAARRLWTLTGSKVRKTTEHAKLKDWLAGRGIQCDSLNKNVVADVIATCGKDEDAIEAVELFTASSKNSTSKATKALRMMMPDGHVRGVFNYYGAGTGRFTAQDWQAHNQVRLDEETELPTVREVIKILDRFEPQRAVEVIDLIFGKPMHWLAKCGRPTIKAPAGYVFRGADLSNIEGRVNAWVANETWKLEAFKAFDEKRGADLYRVTAGGLLNIDPLKVTSAQRQTLGKVPELASGYQGSVMAYVTMGVTTGVKPDMIAEVAAQVTDPAVWAKVADGYRPQYSCGLEKSVWTGIKVVVNGWRAKNPKIVQSWWDRQDAVLEAVGNPGEMVSICDGRLRYLSAHGFLWCMLASGRMIAYPQPSVTRVKYMREHKEIINGVEVIIEEEAWKNAVEVWGIDGKTKQWAPYTLYGGILCENDDQGLSRDICFDGAQRQTEAGYDVCFHCHDETLAVCKPSFGSSKEIESLLTMRPTFDLAGTLPLAAKAWEDERYVK